MSTEAKRRLPDAQIVSPNKKRRLYYTKDPNNLPKQIYVQIYGEGAKIELTNTIQQKLEKHESRLKVHDLQHLILWLFECEVSRPMWIQVRNKHSIKKVVMIQVDGLTEEITKTLPVFQDVFSPTQCYPLKIDTSIFSENGVSENFLKVDMNRLEDVKQTKSCFPKQSWTFEDLLLTRAELRANLYPEEGLEAYKDYINTKNWTQAPNPYGVLAIDCEMVETSAGLELCQCSVIDTKGNTLMNDLVLPRRMIICYNTKWSGVSAKTLRGVTKRLEDVQEALKKWITAETILIGHSFENDLNALQLIHSRILDTAVLYPHHTGRRKNSLKYLSKRYLERKIQKGDGFSGHNPVEDAQAALELTNLKVKNGPGFGVNFVGKHSLPKIFRRLHRNVHIFGSHLITNRYKSFPASLTTLEAKDPDVVSKVSKVIIDPKIDLTWVQLMRGFMNVSDPENAERVNSTITKLWEISPPQTLLIVHTGRRRLKRLKSLQQRSIEARIKKGPQITARERKELKTLSKDVTNHNFWLAVKNDGLVLEANSDPKPFTAPTFSNPLETSTSPPSLPTSSPPYLTPPSSSPAAALQPSALK